MSNAGVIAQGGRAIGDGIRQALDKRQERKRIETRLSTLPDFEDRKDDLATMSLAELQGMEDSAIMIRAEQLQKQKSEMMQAQLERMQQENAARPGQQDVDMEIARLQKQKLEQSLAPQDLGGPEEIMPGVKRIPMGNGQHQLIDTRRDEKPPAGFEHVDLPNGERLLVPNFDPKRALTEEGELLFGAAADQDNPFSQVLIADIEKKMIELQAKKAKGKDKTGGFLGMGARDIGVELAKLQAERNALGGGTPKPARRPQPAEAPPASEAGAVGISTQEEFERLPPGTRFIYNGREGVKR